jgi:hypothetical protein
MSKKPANVSILAGSNPELNTSFERVAENKDARGTTRKLQAKTLPRSPYTNANPVESDGIGSNLQGDAAAPKVVKRIDSAMKRPQKSKNL